MLNLIDKSQIKQMSVRKANHSKALYNFTRKQKLKGSTSTKDLDDSLEHQQVSSQACLPSPTKKPHHRTQSCPFITEPLKLEYTPTSKVNQSQRSEKDQMVRSSRNKVKNAHRHYPSQAELDNLSNAPSISIQNLSSGLYRKTLKQGGLKKSAAGNNLKSKQFFVTSDIYSKTRIDHQMKAYELSEELKEIQRKSKGINIKQQILQNLIQRFEEDLVPGELMLS